MSSTISLKDRHADVTRQLILNTAVELLERSGVTDLTIRAVAKSAGMSERTVFRYFPTRDKFLEAVADETAARLSVPEPPSSLEELIDYADKLYRGFEEQGKLTEAALHSEIYARVRKSSAASRWQSVESLIDSNASRRSAQKRKMAATNINYFLSASTWHYYRFNFGLSLDESIACARSAVKLIVEDVCGR